MTRQYRDTVKYANERVYRDVKKKKISFISKVINRIKAFFNK